MQWNNFKWTWSHIDEADDPSYFVRFMDDIRPASKQEDFFAYRSLTLLEVAEGQSILDVGCGSGGISRALAKAVGETGKVLGVDISQVVIATAQERSRGIDLPIHFQVADAQQLPFPDNLFDSCYSNGLFELLENPKLALSEMIRVAKQGGRIVIVGPDNGITVDSSYITLTRKINDFICDQETNGWIGRQLPSLFRECGLTDIKVLPSIQVLTDFDRMYKFWFQKYLKNAVQARALTPSQANQWLEDLQARAKDERFFAAMTVFQVGGRKL